MPYITDDDIRNSLFYRESEARDGPMGYEELPFSPGAELQSILDATFIFADLLREEDGGIPHKQEDWKMKEVIGRLVEYGYDGRYIDAYGEVQPRENEDLAQDIEDLGTLLGWVPKNWFLDNDDDGSWHAQRDQPICSYGALEIIFGTVRARYRLDSGKQLTVLDVALLADMNQKSVQNATQKKLGDKRLVIAEPDTGDSMAEAKFANTPAWLHPVSNFHAKRWLKDRRAFVKSDVPQAEIDEPDEENSGPYIDEFIMIPISDKGKAFLPDEADLSGRIGNESFYEIRVGNEVKEFKDYFDALDILNTLRDPRWHVGRKNGHIRIAEGSRWIRKEKVKLLGSCSDLLEKKEAHADTLKSVFGGKQV